MERPIKVMVIDDSALVRQTLKDIISSDSQLEVIATAADPYIAANKIRHNIPDVITLDIEMPRMDGLTFLKTLMVQCPLPVVIISSLTQEGSRMALRALDLGAVEVVAKSEIRATKMHLEESQIRITDAIKAAYMAPVRRMALNRPLREEMPIIKSIRSVSTEISENIIAIGASTGGTEALRYILKDVPANSVGIVVTQHMPAGFTRSFAEQLNSLCNVSVKEASDGDRIMRGHVYIAPGGRHMEIYRTGSQFFIRVSDGELVNRHRPSVDVLFNSVAEHAGIHALGIIMTGMGRDGAEGLRNMKAAGAKTIAQDEASSVVFGMPREAIKLGAAEHVLSLTEIGARIKKYT
jgi:two-component system chemotaxis response regulator CheB